jgi:hypothetical protein
MKSGVSIFGGLLEVHLEFQRHERHEFIMSSCLFSILNFYSLQSRILTAAVEPAAARMVYGDVYICSNGDYTVLVLRVQHRVRKSYSNVKSNGSPSSSQISPAK